MTDQLSEPTAIDEFSPDSPQFRRLCQLALTDKEYRDLFPPCNHALKDGDQVLVLDPFRAHVRSYDIGVPAVIETIDCHDIDDSHEVFLVWPSGTGLWVDVENVRVVGS